MRRRLLVPLLALSAMAFSAPAGAEAPYSPPEGDFQVAFPDPPAVQSRPAVRSRDVGRRLYVEKAPGRIMVVSIDDYPDGDLPQAADGGVYDHMLRVRAGDEQAQLVSTRAARLSGRPCLQGTIATSNGDHEIVRILMLGNRIYELTFVTPAGVDPQGADAAFFHSFRIDSRPSGS